MFLQISRKEYSGGKKKRGEYVLLPIEELESSSKEQVKHKLHLPKGGFLDSQKSKLESIVAQNFDARKEDSVSELSSTLGADGQLINCLLSKTDFAAHVKSTGLSNAAYLCWGKQVAASMKSLKIRYLHIPCFLEQEQMALFVEGIWFNLYSFQELKSKPKAFAYDLFLYPQNNDHDSYQELVETLEKRFASLGQSLKLGKSPANVVYPEFFSQFAETQLKEKANVTVEVWDEARLQKEGMELLLAVGKGSPRESQLLILDYKGDSSNKEHVALVGKGVCFDTGGSNLKPGAAMLGMHGDMTGAAVVYGTFHYLASTKAPINVKAYIPLVENQIGGEAIKPGDVFRSAMGKTVEILNTDAEGRLILADALHEASKHKPKVIVDCATLTGAAVVALGPQCAAFYSNNQDVANQFRSASDYTAETAWQMPLFRPYKSLLEGKVADFSNIANNGKPQGGSITAALFLEEFACGQDANQPWVHLDLACWGGGETHVCFGDSTQAMGVRLLSRFVLNLK